jgi:hypothetical protein
MIVMTQPNTHSIETASRTKETHHMPETITRDQYRAARKHGYAGTARELAHPDQWPATHWVMKSNENGATILAAVTIAD